MSLTAPPRPAARRRSTVLASVVAPVVAAFVIIGGALGGLLGHPYLPSGSSSSSSSSASPVVTPGDHLAAPGGAPLRPRPRLGADGSVPDGVTVFSERVPAVTNLDPALLAALRRAATEAADDGVTFVVNSGWRTPDYQERLLRNAVAEYGSEREAARWVATPGTSPHVSGAAVDLGPDKALRWLSEHGAAYGLCQIYGNEPWHYELRPGAVTGGCPPRYADPTHDPRMQK